ncbi:MAG: hypothetical protein IJ534_01720 [Bacteroidaceae bacterium]|nr:hypothetical protein [Bacteroidaceae bacterium]
MITIWDYILTGGHPYKNSFWRKEFEQIAQQMGVTPDHVYAIARGVYLMDDKDREIKDVLRKKGILYSILL